MPLIEEQFEKNKNVFNFQYVFDRIVYSIFVRIIKSSYEVTKSYKCCRINLTLSFCLVCNVCYLTPTVYWLVFRIQSDELVSSGKPVPSEQSSYLLLLPTSLPTPYLSFNSIYIHPGINKETAWRSSLNLKIICGNYS